MEPSLQEAEITALDAGVTALALSCKSDSMPVTSEYLSLLRYLLTLFLTLLSLSLSRWYTLHEARVDLAASASTATTTTIPPLYSNNDFDNAVVVVVVVVVRSFCYCTALPAHRKSRLVVIYRYRRSCSKQVRVQAETLSRFLFFLFFVARRTAPLVARYHGGSPARHPPDAVSQ